MPTTQTYIELDYVSSFGAPTTANEEEVVADVRQWLASFGVEDLDVEVISLNGPGGGWPLIRLAGDEDSLRAVLAEYDPDDMTDIEIQEY